jgi:hypothetical protein
MSQLAEIDISLQDVSLRELSKGSRSWLPLAVDSRWIGMGVIATVLALARGMRVWELGVYWDDWRILTRGLEGGPRAILQYLAGERLFMGVPHAFLFSVFGPRPLAWHVSNLVLELGIALVAYALLRRMLPRYSLFPVLATCLFIAYPMSVIRTHMIDVYINLALLLALLSIYFTSKSATYALYLRSRYRLLTVLAVVLMPLYLLSYELPIGLEVVRLWILWTLVTRDFDGESLARQVVRLARLYLPYAAGLTVFVVVRTFIQPRIVRAIGANLRGGMGVDSFAMPSPVEVIQSFVHMIFGSWLNAWSLIADVHEVGWTRTFAWFLSITVFLLVFGYGVLLSRQTRAQALVKAEQTNKTIDWLKLFAFTLTAMGACLALMWLHPNQTVNFFNLNSRNGYVATVVGGAVCLALVGAFVSIVVSSEFREPLIATVAGLLIAVGTGYNFLLADKWIAEWRQTQSTWNQMLERVPSIKEGSLIVLSQPDRFKALDLALRDREIYEPAQLFYNFGYTKIFGSPVVRGTDQSILPWLGTSNWDSKGAEVPVGPQESLINRQQILILDNSEGCLKALDSRRQVQLIDANGVNSISEFSNLNVIEADSGEDIQLRRILLGPPQKDWCLYYARASFLEQQENWSKVNELYDIVMKAKLRPTNPIEWLPYIEALHRNDRCDLANDLTLLVRAGSDHSRKAARETLLSLRKEHQCAGSNLAIFDHQIALLDAEQDNQNSRR